MTELPFTTPLQFVGLALALLAGWLLGMATSANGRRWREQYEQERDQHQAVRNELSTANTRIRDLEAANSRLERNLADRRAPEPAHSDPKSRRETAMRSWFYGGTDVLSRIRGIDEHRERQLNQLGIQQFRDIENLPREDELPLEERLGVPHGTIVDEQWREQAAMLRSGHAEEHERRFGRVA
ncbi:hypothetical protein ACNFJ7_08620 [Sphingomonas sp. HT-1]|jgi:predicted flap endonuclease-1-like 5' DNA nuclease|uniref:hypothetical protein n=1 Tax=unclassified Sphingomonas TaxID=196159 RepID=UPI0002E163A1|nr:MULTISPECIES: hypothetical protein [unclassified Sphingomonas]KTF67910.1 hypothetical protein ATB93_01905 [Sphingomonas sp. WG]